MSSDQTLSARAPDKARAFQVRPRALASTPTYWFAMFAASALGTNLGDFWVDELGLGRWVSFASLAAISMLAILADRFGGGRSEGGYWVAIVALRAAATNVGDVLTHDLRFSYVGVAVGLAVLTLGAGAVTRRADDGFRTPRIDGRYWMAMLIAGVFGTVAGDLAAHTVGLFAAAGLLCALLLAALAWRAAFAPAALLAYWLVVLAERSAGTPVGDALASPRGLGLGLDLAVAVTAGAFVIGLLVRFARPR